MKRLLCACSLFLWMFCAPAIAEEALRIADLSASPEAVQSFQSSYPSMRLIAADTFFDSQEAFISRLLTQDDTIDIYAITVNMGLENLKEKGFLPVIESSVIQKEMACWYPQILECVSTEKGIVAVPYELTTNEWGVNQSLWAELCPEQTFTTWMDYLHLILTWDANSDFLQDYSISYSGLTREEVARSLVFSYISHYETADQPLDFDTEVFRECLKTLKLLPEKKQTDEDEEAWNERLNLPTLLNETPENIGSNADVSHQFTAIPEPGFTKEDAPVVRGDMRMYVLNPYSKHKDEAVHFLEAVIETMPSTMRIRFSASEEAPIENPFWIKHHEQLQDKLLLLEQKDSEPTREDADAIERLREQLSDERDRYLVTVEEKQRYEELIVYLKFFEKSCFFGFQNGDNIDALMNVIHRYLSDSVSLDKCIDELNRISSQIFYEQ